MSCRNASSSSRRSESSRCARRVVAGRRSSRPDASDHRSAETGISSRRAIRSSSFGAYVAELLLLGEGLAEERPGDVEVAAERVEAGEVVAGVGGGTSRPAAAVDDRGDVVGELERPRFRPAAAAIGVRWVSVCSEPLPMIVPLIRRLGERLVGWRPRSRRRARRSTRPRRRRPPATTSATRSAWNLAFASSVSTSIGSFAPIRSARSRSTVRPFHAFRCAWTSLGDQPPSGAGASRTPGSSAARTSRSAARAARMPAMSPARRPAALVSGLVHRRDGTRQRRAVTRGWRRSSGRRHPNRRHACRSA